MDQRGRYARDGPQLCKSIKATCQLLVLYGSILRGCLWLQGAGHDGSNEASHCPASGNIMASVGCGNCPRTAGAPAIHGDVGGLNEWSPCSDTYVTDTLQNLAGLPSNCLTNDPRAPVGGDVCGDRIVSGTEACDDGTAGSTLCSTACTLMPGIACASGACCNTATGEFKTTGELCRTAMHQCDLPDYCSGVSATCDADLFKADGTECQEGGIGAQCYGGSCKGLDAQCSAAFDGWQGTWSAHQTAAGEGVTCENGCGILMCNDVTQAPPPPGYIAMCISMSSEYINGCKHKSNLPFFVILGSF